MIWKEAAKQLLSLLLKTNKRYYRLVSKYITWQEEQITDEESDCYGIKKRITMQPDDVSVHLDLGEPPVELLEYAKENIGEIPDTRPAAVQDLRDLIYERGDVEVHRSDDSFLLRFLRARQFHGERAYRLLVNYYKFKENNPEIHKGIDPMKLNFIGEDDVLGVLPYREQTGRRIMIYRVGNWDPSRYGVDEIMKATVVILELAVLEQRAQILGGVCIFDLGGLSLSHAWHVTPALAAKVVNLLGLSFPIRIHAIHVINQSWVFDMVFAIFKPLLDQRMRDKIYVHGDNLESLHSHIDPKFLPEKYGGSRPEYSYKDWMDSLSANPDIIKEMSSLGYIISDDDDDDKMPTF